MGWAVAEVSPTPAPLADTETVITIEIGKSRITANTGTDLELLGNVYRMLMSLC